MNAAIWIWFSTMLVYGQVKAKQGYGPGEQEWGYVTVRPQAHMFWWLYYVNSPTTPSANFSVYDKPLLIWLQGGPGASSTGYGNFEELGPIDLQGNFRNYSWVHDYNVLFIDSPVGTGFSYVDNDTSYVTNNNQIGVDLVECIQEFFLSHQKFADVPTYITGESYAGKMAPEFALLWFKAQKNKLFKSNLKGIAIGNPSIIPIDALLQWAPYLLETSMIDKKGYNQIQEIATQVKIAGDENRWTDAHNLRVIVEDLIGNMTDNMDFYNILWKAKPQNVTHEYLSEYSSRDERSQFLNELMNKKVKETLKLNVTWSSQRSMVFENLKADRMKPVIHLIERLLNETDLKVFIFSGHLDMVISTLSTLNWIENMKWQGSKEWENSKREPLVVDNIIEGYVKAYKKFKMYWIFRSGHMAPTDNPYAVKKILEHLISIR